VSVQPKRRVLLLAGPACAVAASGCAAVSEPESIRRLIVEQSREWTASYVSGNTDVMQRILAHDFVNTDPKGRKGDKARAIEAARRGPELLHAASVGPVEVRVFGQMAVAFGGDVLVLKRGPTTTVRTAWTDTWLLRDGQWAVIASHESEVELENA
jgi:hypothetical protein